MELHKLFKLTVQDLIHLRSWMPYCDLYPYWWGLADSTETRILIPVILEMLSMNFLCGLQDPEVFLQ